MDSTILFWKKQQKYVWKYFYTMKKPLKNRASVIFGLHGRCQSNKQSWWNEKWQNESDNTIPFLTKKEDYSTTYQQNLYSLIENRINFLKDSFDFSFDIFINISWKNRCILWRCKSYLIKNNFNLGHGGTSMFILN